MFAEENSTFRTFSAAAAITKTLLLLSVRRARFFIALNANANGLHLHVTNKIYCRICSRRYSHWHSTAAATIWVWEPVPAVSKFARFCHSESLRRHDSKEQIGDDRHLLYLFEIGSVDFISIRFGCRHRRRPNAFNQNGNPCDTVAHARCANDDRFTENVE